MLNRPQHNDDFASNDQAPGEFRLAEQPREGTNVRLSFMMAIHVPTQQGGDGSAVSDFQSRRSAKKRFSEKVLVNGTSRRLRAK